MQRHAQMANRGAGSGKPGRQDHVPACGNAMSAVNNAAIPLLCVRDEACPVGSFDVERWSVPALSDARGWTTGNPHVMISCMHRGGVAGFAKSVQ